MRTKSRFLRAGSVVGVVVALVVRMAAAEAPVGSDELLAQYGKVHAALADDSAVGAAEAAKELAASADAVAGRSQSAASYRPVAEAARALAAAGAIEKQRENFKDLSLAMAKLVDSGQLKGAGMFFCPMVDGYWLQKAGDDALRNPYYGKSMLRCGEKVDKVEEG